MRAIAAACCLLMGCLVTEKKEFPERTFCPPSIETETLTNPMHPLDSIIILDVTEGSGGDAGPANRVLSFEVDIRDCNEDQDLEYKVFKGGDVVDDEVIKPEFRSPFSFNVTFDDVAPACERVEFVVTEQFKHGPDREPVRDGDIGTATWWVAIVADGAAVVDMVTECQEQP